MNVSFDCTKDELRIIREIAKRAHERAARNHQEYLLIDAEMDVCATHANGCPLRLEELLGADDFNFAHDVFGIRAHLDRESGTLRDCFLPRFAQH